MSTCIVCGEIVTPILDTFGKVDRWVGPDGSCAADDDPNAYDRLDALRAAAGADVDAAADYSMFKVRLAMGVTFHEHAGVDHA